MNFKVLFFLFLFAFTQNSEAQLRCFNLFATNQQDYQTSKPKKEIKEKKIQNDAKIIDAINSYYNQNIFEKNFSAVLNGYSKNIFEDVKLSYQAAKLRKALKELKNAGDWNDYEFENFSKKLLKISFLSNPEVIDKMEPAERAIFLQAKHTALTEGLKSFFFEGTNTSEKVQRTVFQWIKFPFQKVYLRWLIAPVKMPTLNGTVISLPDAEKLLWSGTKNNPEIVAKYKLSGLYDYLDFRNKTFRDYFNVFSTAQGKQAFNTYLSPMYNWSILSAVIISFSAYSYLTYGEIMEAADQKSQQTMAPTVKFSEDAAKADYNDFALKRDIANYTSVVQMKYHRDPTPEELAAATEIFKQKAR